MFDKFETYLVSTIFIVLSVAILFKEETISPHLRYNFFVRYVNQ